MKYENTNEDALVEALESVGRIDEKSDLTYYETPPIA